MYARTITIDARPGAMDAGIEYIRYTVFGEVTSKPGCVGMSLVADRAGNRCIATSSWESEQAMKASEQSLQSTRKRGADAFGAAAPEMAEWEVVAMHRDHRAPEGACVRASWLETDPAKVSENIDFIKSTTMPQVEQLPGFTSASLLVNRSTGRSIFTAAYDSRAAMDATRDRANDLRSGYAAQSGARVLEVREFDLVLAHLRAPEVV